MSVLYVVAVPEFLTAAHRRVQPGRVLQLTRYYRRRPSVNEVVLAMRGIAARPRSISLLSFQCHGYEGAAILWDNGRAWLDLDYHNVSAMRGFREYMAPGGRVEFHSCNTASEFGPDRSIEACEYDGATAARADTSSFGQLFMQGMADAVECPVTAAVRYQPGSMAIGFCGPTVTFRPALTCR